MSRPERIPVPPPYSDGPETNARPVPPQPEPTDPPERFQLLALGFNVTTAQRLVSDGRKPVYLRPQQARCGLVYVDEAHAMSEAVDPAVPGIMATLPCGTGTLLIDGNHRAHKAWKLGHPLVPVLVLSELESQLVCDTPVAWAALARRGAGS